MSTNTNYAIMTEYKLREAKVLNHYGSWWKDRGVDAGDKGGIEDIIF